MIDRGNRVPWTCYANPLGFDAELAELMAAAGCAGMEVGADSGSDKLLDTLGKGFTTKQIRALSSMAKDAGIPDCHTFLLGTPGETYDDVLRTLDFIVDLDPFGAILMAWVDRLRGPRSRARPESTTPARSGAGAARPAPQPLSVVEHPVPRRQLRRRAVRAVAKARLPRTPLAAPSRPHCARRAAAREAPAAHGSGRDALDRGRSPCELSRDTPRRCRSPTAPRRRSSSC